jgi:2-phospho-L-lactate guanylyltransferase
MLEDVIQALLPLAFPVAVVTNSARTAARVEKLGWRIFWEEEQISESASVDAASKRLASEGVDAVLRLPADLPLVQPGDVESLLSLSIAAPCAVLAPSWDRKGTNALLRRPPALFPSRFGPNSFALHLEEAAATGAQIKVVENPRLALDLDDASDMVRFLAQLTDCRTYHALINLDIEERLARHAVQCDPHSGIRGNS